MIGESFKEVIMKALICMLVIIVLTFPVFSLTKQYYPVKTEYKPFQKGIPGSGFGTSSHGYEKFVDTIPVKKEMSLIVLNDQGNVRVIGWDKPYMKVEAKKLCTICKENLKQVAISISTKKSTIVIETKNPYNLRSITVHYTLYVPAHLFISSVKTDGKLVLRNVMNQASDDVLMNT